MAIVTMNVEFLWDVTPCSSLPAVKVNLSPRRWRQQSPLEFGKDLSEHAAPCLRKLEIKLTIYFTVHSQHSQSKSFKLF